MRNAKFWAGMVCGAVMACAMAVFSAPPGTVSPVGQTLQVTCTSDGGMKLGWIAAAP